MDSQIMLLVSPSMREPLLQRFDKFIFPADKVEVRQLNDHLRCAASFSFETAQAAPQSPQSSMNPQAGVRRELLLASCRLSSDSSLTIRSRGRGAFSKLALVSVPQPLPHTPRRPKPQVSDVTPRCRMFTLAGPKAADLLREIGGVRGHSRAWSASAAAGGLCLPSSCVLLFNNLACHKCCLCHLRKLTQCTSHTTHTHTTHKPRTRSL